MVIRKIILFATRKIENKKLYFRKHNSTLLSSKNYELDFLT